MSGVGGVVAAILLILTQKAALPDERALPQSHRDVSGSETICGITASSAIDFIEKIKAQPHLRRGDGGPHFELYSNADQTIQWTMIKKGESAYPAVSCRSVQEQNGSLTLVRSLRCDASRDTCDALARENGALDDALRSALGSAR